MADLPPNLLELEDHAARLSGLLESKRFALTRDHPNHSAWTTTQIDALAARVGEIKGVCAAWRARTD
jgi:hypothetical protein